MISDVLEREHGEIRRAAFLRLSNFRNYDSLDLELQSGFHVIAGENAQGKTNLLEALEFIASTRLLRGIRDAEAIQEGAPRLRVECDLADVGTTLGLTVERGARKRAYLNGLGLPRASDLIGRLLAVCISSADLPLVIGEPSDRRLFLDLELSQLYPGYLRAFTLYKRALEQRNALLKMAQEQFMDSAAFEPWEHQMAESGSAMRSYRRRYVDDLALYASQVQEELGQGEELSTSYLQKDEAFDAPSMERLFAEGRRGEVARGSTLVGPHRDDLTLLVDRREARLYGSQGQQRSTVVSLKLATFELIRRKLGQSPLLLLDDMLSDLDEGRRARLCAWIVERAGQALLTCTEPAAAGPQILERSTILKVVAGKIEVQ